MKVKRKQWTIVEEEIPMNEILESLFEEEWYPSDWEDTEGNFRASLEFDDPDITEEDEDIILAEAKKEFDKRVLASKEEEIKKLSNRRSILNWLSTLHGDSEDYYTEEGDVGFALDLEEILDLIIKNGNK